MLSLITFALATVTLIIFYDNDTWYDFGNYISPIEDDEYNGYGACAIGGSVSDTLFPLCGSSLLNSNTIPSSTTTDSWVWIAWGNCMAWMLLCCYNKLKEVMSEETYIWPDPAFLHHQWMQRLKEIKGKVNGRLLVLMLTSAHCFGLQFYLINAFNRHHLVSQDWSFGQIIAVTVWIPSVLDFYHDTLSKFYVTRTHSFEDWLSSVESQKDTLKSMYSSILKKMKAIVPKIAKLANHSPREGPNNTLTSGSDIEAVQLSYLNSTERSNDASPSGSDNEAIQPSGPISLGGPNNVSSSGADTEAIQPLSLNSTEGPNGASPPGSDPEAIQLPSLSSTEDDHGTGG